MSINLSEQKRNRLLNNIKIMREKLQEDPELLQSLADMESELKRKKYGLVWEEHEEKVDEELKTKIPVFVEDKELEIQGDIKKPINFLLEGDNLHSLYLLEKTHKESIDVIYIDPPYNTTNKDFIYNDEMIGIEDSYRHSKWLSFMEKRLITAKKILSQRGIIFISIDDNEYSQLKLLCDEVFGETNYVSTLHWKKKKQPSYLHGQVAGVMEYILIYSKDRLKLDKLSLSSPTDSNTRVDNASNQISERIIKKGIRVKLPQNVNIIKAGIYKNKTMETEYLNDVIIENGITQNDFKARARFRDSQERIDLFCEENVLFITKNYGFRRDKLAIELEKKKAITDLILDWGDNQDSDLELRKIFGEKVFSYPKPVNLIKNLIKSTGYKNSTILDFFAGSGTTGQAVLELNDEDKGKRKFILCTNNQNNICKEITYKRFKKIFEGYSAEKEKKFNLKYYKTEYIDRFNHKDEQYYIINELSKYIKELVQLENGIDINDKSIQILFTDEEIDEFSKNESLLKECKILYVDTNALITDEQIELFEKNNITVLYIPEYYFEDEILEVEQW